MCMIRLSAVFIICVLLSSCREDSLSSLDNVAINSLLDNINEEGAIFTKKDVAFDSIITLAGSRVNSNLNQKIKMKLFYFDGYARGYFNLSENDDKNLQVFGQKVENYWAFKCVTKLNMEEAGGYMLFDDYNNGLWSNGHINFRKEKISLKKQNIDYTELNAW